MPALDANLKLPLNVSYIRFKVCKTYKHDPGAFTEGLELHDGFLYESTGGQKGDDPPQSSLRLVRLETGEVLKKIPVDDQLFAEGITIFGEKLFQLTDRSHLALCYDIKNLKPARHRLKYDGWDRGWGLAHDDRHLILSDSTTRLLFIDPNRFKIAKAIPITDGSNQLDNLNDLEFVKGFIYANYYPSDLILRIDPRTGKVLGQIDLGPVRPTPPDPFFVANGIAHDEKSGHLLVTGKRWPTLIEIELLG